MADVNTVLLTGKVISEVSLHTTANNNNVAKFKIETLDANESFYLNIVCWNNVAVFAKDNLTEGNKVLIDGRLKLDRWNNAQGEERSQLKIIGEKIILIGR
jgi:single-strand DNA-binding protein